MTRTVVGIDEVGRGPLAGPVVAAVVLLDPKAKISILRDSKTMSAKQREQSYLEITGSALAWSVGQAEVEEIDRINILQALFLAMQRAVAGLGFVPDLALVDGNQAPRLICPVRMIVGGDNIEPCISAASIVAKVTRDRMMVNLCNEYPGYGFAKHKGYGTALHLAALETLGPCPIHRQSFAPVARLLERITEVE
ncbi:MAG: ribonuclease HII [Pseudomonadota bacterium]|nr:ribonuclease HII [Pseudomonadota bacterium]